MNSQQQEVPPQLTMDNEQQQQEDPMQKYDQVATHLPPGNAHIYKFV